MKTPTKLNRCYGLTRIEVVAVAAVTLTLAGYLLLPRTTGHPVPANSVTCVNNLKQVGIAFRIWAGDHQDRYPMNASITNGGTKEFVATGVVSPHFQVMSNELSTPKILVCPTDKPKVAARSFASGFANANISYFVGLDATDVCPQMFLAGDANLCRDNALLGSGLFVLQNTNLVSWSDTWHEKQGKVLLVDGSVQGYSSPALRDALKNTGSSYNTTRLALP